MKGKGGSLWPWAFVNFCVIALVGFALWYTHNLWSFLGLLFLFSTRPSSFDTRCPKCNFEFVATPTSDDEEDED